MGVLDTLLRRKKVTKTTIIERSVEVYEPDDEISDEDLKHEVVGTLQDLDQRVRMLELEIGLYGRD